MFFIVLRDNLATEKFSLYATLDPNCGKNESPGLLETNLGI